jgi:hypothetical protein
VSKLSGRCLVVDPVERRKVMMGHWRKGRKSCCRLIALAGSKLWMVPQWQQKQ